MAIDTDTYYYFVDDMGLIPLWWEMYGLDKYPALRFEIIMKQIHTEEISVNSYDKSGELDEFNYSKDMHHGIFDEIMLNKLRITPGKEYEFFTIAIKIETQKCIYLKNSDHFPIENKLDYMRTMLQAYNVRRLFEPSFITMSDEYVKYLESSIAELESKTESESLGSPGPKITDSPNKSHKVEPNFESFFPDQEMIQPLLNYLYQEKVLSSTRKWIGKFGGSSDFMGFVDALRLESIIEFDKITIVGKSFKKFFTATLSERSMRDKSFKREDSCESYRSILVDFKLQYHQSKKENK